MPAINGRPRIGKQGTLSSMGLDMLSTRSFPQNGRMDLRGRAAMQGKMGTDTSTYQKMLKKRKKKSSLATDQEMTENA